MEIILRIFRFTLLSAAYCLPFTIFMKTPYEIFVSLRYLKTKKRYGTISLNTFISIAGVVIGEETDGHSIRYSDTTATSSRRPGINGLLKDPEVQDIVKLYRAPIAVGATAGWSYG